MVQDYHNNHKKDKPQEKQQLTGKKNSKASKKSDQSNERNIENRSEKPDKHKFISKKSKSLSSNKLKQQSLKSSIKIIHPSNQTISQLNIKIQQNLRNAQANQQSNEEDSSDSA